MRLSVLIPLLTSAFLAACQTTDPDWGHGPIRLSPAVQQAFDRYMATDGAMLFAVSTDGRVGFFTYCPLQPVHCEDAYREALDGCRRNVGGRIDCKIFADGHQIVWQGKVTMASSGELRALQNVKNAKYCFDSRSKTYYVVGGQCLFEDEEVSREAYAAGVNARLAAYCRTASSGAFYTAVGGCRSGDAVVTELEYDRSRQYCHGDGSTYYVAHGPCKSGDSTVSADDYRRATAEKAR